MSRYLIRFCLRIVTPDSLRLRGSGRNPSLRHFYEELTEKSKNELLEICLAGSRDDVLSRKSRNSSVPYTFFHFPHLESVSRSEDKKVNWKSVVRHFPRRIFLLFLSYCFGTIYKGVYLLFRLLFLINSEAILCGLQDVGYASVYKLTLEEMLSLELFCALTQA